MRRDLFIPLVLFIILVLGTGIGYCAVNYTSTVGYAVSKGDNFVWIISSGSQKEALDTYKSSEIRGGLVLIGLKEETVREVEIGQKVKAYHSKQINASAPSDVDPLFIRLLED